MPASGELGHEGEARSKRIVGLRSRVRGLVRALLGSKCKRWFVLSAVILVLLVSIPHDVPAAGSLAETTLAATTTTVTPMSESKALPAATTTVTPTSESEALPAATTTVTPTSESEALPAATTTVTPTSESVALPAATTTVTPTSESEATLCTSQLPPLAPHKVGAGPGSPLGDLPYFLHIAKAGGEGMGNRLSQLYNSLNTQPGRVCNHFAAPTSAYPKWVAEDANNIEIAAAPHPGKRINKPCWLHMSESRYFQEVPPRKQVTLLRDPATHVISM
jgi:hypothetical protein